MVTVQNHGDQALNVTSVTLTDYEGVARPAGNDPWALEKESKTLERRYRDAGVAFAQSLDEEETLKTVVSWARFSELFSYDDDAASFSLENPT